MSKQSGGGTLVLALVALGAVGLLWFSWGGESEDAPPPEPVSARSAPAAGMPLAEPRTGARFAERGRADAAPGVGTDAPATLKRRVAGAVAPARNLGDRARMRDRGGAGSEDESMPREARKAPEDTFDVVRARALSDPDPDERIRALESLNGFEGQSVVPILTQALSDHDPEVRLAALEEMTFVTDDPPLDALSIALGDADPEVRATALRMVADSEDQAKWPLIQNALQDPDEDVRNEAEDIVDLEDAPDQAR